MISEIGNEASVIETDIYFFAPRNFELSAIGKHELRKDFRTRIRLSLPVSGEQGSLVFDRAIASMQKTLILMDSTNSNHISLPQDHLNDALSEDLLEALKDLAAVLSETLKTASREQARTLLLAQSLMSAPQPCLNGLHAVRKSLQSIRTMIHRTRHVSPTDNKAAQSILALFDEYISQLYVQYLGSVRATLNNILLSKNVRTDESCKHERGLLEALLNQCQSQEAKHRRKFSDPSSIDTRRGNGSLESLLAREQRLIRLSHLKKFFQSKTFVDVARRPPARLFTESTAAAGTAVAGILATLVEHVSKPEISNVAFQGLFVISFGVIIYTLRDRLKDRVKSIFQQRALEHLPDSDHHLVVRERKIGLIREWYRVLETSLLSEDIKKARSRALRSSIEAKLGPKLQEEVLHCRKRQEVSADFGGADRETQTSANEYDEPAFNGQSQRIDEIWAHSSYSSYSLQTSSRAFYEITRFNIERYLKHMDDAFKEFTDLDHNGRVHRSRSHRVYHFYLCIKTAYKPLTKTPILKRLAQTWKKDPRADSTAASTNHTVLYRVVMDKTGLVRIDPIGEA